SLQYIYKKDNIKKDKITLDVLFDDNNTDELIINEENNKDNNTDKNTEIIYVHLCGAVIDEGVYEVAYGTRLIELINLANGLKENAASSYINQAVILEDGQRIYIPTLEELDNIQASNFNEIDETDKAKININTANISELIEIPGIGEAKAKSIIEYRQANGKFKMIEDIMKIPGIKQGVFDKMSPYIVAK
ncbi:MAG TPA: hypothetical protein GXZ90_06740, partial [Clostridiales bacterium]|nr:hypothetical protein [Clostridiales bacterium]